MPANLLQAQRDYFGAHTFKVLPGKENERLAAGMDIRKFCLDERAKFTHSTLQISTGLDVEEMYLHRLILYRVTKWNETTPCGCR